MNDPAVSLAATTGGVDSRPRPPGCTSFKLHRLARLVGRRYDAQLARAGLTTPQYSLLNVVHWRGPLRPVDLARFMGLSSSTLTRNLRPLISAGWVVSVPGPDARSRLLQLSEAGVVRLLEARGDWRRAQDAIETLLGLENVALLHQLLDRHAELLSTGESGASACNDDRTRP